MTNAIQTLGAAVQRGMSVRPRVGGFPYLAEALRQAGVSHNEWFLPALTSTYLVNGEYVVNQGTPLVSGMVPIPLFNQDSLIKALRSDQAGESTFPEFLQRTWEAGVVRYLADFEAREVTYFGSAGETYVESYEAVELPAQS